MLNWLQGKTTHIAAIAGIIVAILECAGVVAAPWAIPIIGFIAVSRLRSGVEKKK